MELVTTIRDMPSDEGRPLEIVDFFTGTGCLALLLHARLKPPFFHESMPPIPSLRIRGFDDSNSTIALARMNLLHNLNKGQLHQEAPEDVRFEQLDILALSQQPPPAIRERFFQDSMHQEVDVMVTKTSHPIPPRWLPGGGPPIRPGWSSASEPASANFFKGVLPDDQRYVSLLHIVASVRPKLLVIEVSDTAQARRIRKLCRNFLTEHATRPQTRSGSSRASEGSGTETTHAGEVLIEIWTEDTDAWMGMTHEVASKWYDKEGRIVLEAEARGADKKINDDADRDNDRMQRAVMLWFDHDWVVKRKKDTGLLRGGSLD